MNGNNLSTTSPGVIVYPSKSTSSVSLDPPNDARVFSTLTTLSSVKPITPGSYNNNLSLPSPSSSPITPQRTNPGLARVMNSHREMNNLMSVSPTTCIMSSTPFGSMDVQVEVSSSEQLRFSGEGTATSIIVLPPLIPSSSPFCHQQVLMSSEHDQYSFGQPSIPSSPLPANYSWGQVDCSEGDNHSKNLMTVMMMSPVSSPHPSLERSSSPDVEQMLRSDESLDQQGRESSSLLSSPFITSDSILSSNSRRGRPRLDDITSLIQEATSSPSGIRCKFCSRVFPREKSLQAHLRTHTGERPYSCSFPGCGRAFAQSGQLRTHQRLHTGEKPFMCSSQGCSNRFTHANRHCPLHPDVGVKRDRSLSSSKSFENRSVSRSNNENTSDVMNQPSSSTGTSGKKQKQNRSGRKSAGSIKLRNRKLLQELDAVDDSLQKENHGQSVPQHHAIHESTPVLLESSRVANNITNTVSGTSSQSSQREADDIVWKKKRAALELQKKQQQQDLPGEGIEIQELVVAASTQCDNNSSLPRDKLLGVLALMELSGADVSNETRQLLS